MERRQLLKSGIAGALALWADPSWASALQGAQRAAGPRRLTDTIAVIDDGGSNIVACATPEGQVLVDTGTSSRREQVLSALKGLGGNTKVHTVFNTHYHPEATGNNEAFAAAGATILAHDRTRQWLSVDHWLPDRERYEKARPKGAWPTEVFFNSGSRTIGGQRVDYGYLLMAHTSGDVYVHFKDANVLAVGDVASPVNDPALDWITGAWIGGRVSAMDALLKIGNDQTRVVPGVGPVMTWAEFKAERDLMEVVRQRLFKQVRQGDGAQDMLDGGVLQGLARTWKDPHAFLYAASRGLWGNHNKLDPDVV